MRSAWFALAIALATALSGCVQTMERKIDEARDAASTPSTPEESVAPTPTTTSIPTPISTTTPIPITTTIPNTTPTPIPPSATLTPTPTPPPPAWPHEGSYVRYT